jgi:C4-dicarboxylate transporter, DctQ subunit
MLLAFKGPDWLRAAREADMARAYELLIEAMAYLAATLLGAIILGIGLDVASRFFFNRPIGWMFEYVQFGLICILFLGMPWLTRQGGHVIIDILIDLCPAQVRSALSGISSCLAGVTSGFISYWAFIVANDNFIRGIETIGIYTIPRFLLILVIAVGLALTAAEFFRRALLTFKRLPPAESGSRSSSL